MDFSSHSDSDPDAPPAYEDAVHGHNGDASSSSSNAFHPTSQLQIHAIGYDTTQALTGMTLENISVYRAGPGAPPGGAPEYVSLRRERKSNSCALVRGDDPARTPLIATVYRWGPGRPPKMRILPPHTSATVETAVDPDSLEAGGGGLECELIEVKSRSLVSRAQRMETSFGTFEWRYGGRDERRDAHDAASLLVLELVDDHAAKATTSKFFGRKKKSAGVRVAQLVRNDEFRTPGTTRHMGGNGGRLMMDLSPWADDKKKGTSVKDVEAFVVAGCICMLKREADRFRNNQVAAVV